MDGSVIYTTQFIYDSAGEAVSMVYNGVEYYYVRNGQKGIIGLIDGSGNFVVNYTYDSWGKLLKIDGNTELGYRNPLRYRGYIADDETGLYYVGSRYYDPKIGRWISADDSSVLVNEQEYALNNNVYSYCLNNPVNQYDIDGKFSLPNWAKVAIGAVATVAAVGLTVATGGAVLPLLAGVAVSTAGGAVSGYITGGKQGAIDGAASGFMLGGLSAFATSVVGAVKTVGNYKKMVDSYKSLRKQYKGSGMEVHHIIEKRLTKGSRWGTKLSELNNMPSIALDKVTHRGYTNAWKTAISYGTRYKKGVGYMGKLYIASNKIYKGNRVLKMAARYTIFKMR